MMKLGRLVFSCNGSGISVVSEEAHEGAEGGRGRAARSCHDFPASSARTELPNTIDYAAKLPNSTGINYKDHLNTSLSQPQPVTSNKVNVVPGSYLATHVPIDDHILVPVEVVHTASQMSYDPTSVRTLNWAVAHAAPVQEVGHHMRGVSFAALPKKECKRSASATAEPVPKHTAAAEQTRKDHSSASEPASSLIPVAQETAPPFDNQQATVSHGTYVRADKLIDIAEGELPSFMRPTAIVLSRQPVSTQPPQSSCTWHPSRSLHATNSDDMVGSVARQGGVTTDRRHSLSLSSVASNRAAALRAAHGKAMRQRLADAEWTAPKNNFDKAAAQYRALLLGNNNRKKLAVIPEFKPGSASVRSVAALSCVTAHTRPGPVSTPPVMRNKPAAANIPNNRSTNSSTTVKPGPSSSPAATNKLGNVIKLSNTLVNSASMMPPGPGSSPAVTSKPTLASSRPNNLVNHSKASGKPDMTIKTAQETTSIAVQTDVVMLDKTANKSAGEKHTDTHAPLGADHKSEIDSPGVVQQRVVARLWRGVPSDYVAKNVHL